MSNRELRDLELEIEAIEAHIDILDSDNNLEAQWIDVYEARLDSIIWQIERSSS